MLSSWDWTSTSQVSLNSRSSRKSFWRTPTIEMNKNLTFNFEINKLHLMFNFSVHFGPRVVALTKGLALDRSLWVLTVCKVVIICFVVALVIWLRKHCGLVYLLDKTGVVIFQNFCYFLQLILAFCQLIAHELILVRDVLIDLCLVSEFHIHF